MRLYHTTAREHCASIAVAGFAESRAGKYGRGVYLAIGPYTRASLTLDLAEVGLLDEHLVVFAFDIPDDIAAAHACGGLCYLSPDDPEYDPEIDAPEPGLDAGLPPDEWAVPAEIANLYFAELVHWTGGRPLNLSLIHI